MQLCSVKRSYLVLNRVTCALWTQLQSLNAETLNGVCSIYPDSRFKPLLRYEWNISGVILTVPPQEDSIVILSAYCPLGNLLLPRGTRKQAHLKWKYKDLYTQLHSHMPKWGRSHNPYFSVAHRAILFPHCTYFTFFYLTYQCFSLTCLFLFLLLRYIEKYRYS